VSEVLEPFEQAVGLFLFVGLIEVVRAEATIRGTLGFRVRLIGGLFCTREWPTSVPTAQQKLYDTRLPFHLSRVGDAGGGLIQGSVTQASLTRL
jgi:hypothetical protein